MKKCMHPDVYTDEEGACPCPKLTCKVDCPWFKEQPQRHPHAALIIAWANGLKIQYYSTSDHNWEDILHPSWESCVQYRIKPESKPDIVRYARASYTDYVVGPSGSSRNDLATTTTWTILKGNSDNVRATFDGETGKLKKMEMI